MYMSTALVLASAGTASAATVSPAAATPLAAALIPAPHGTPLATSPHGSVIGGRGHSLTLAGPAALPSHVAPHRQHWHAAAWHRDRHAAGRQHRGHTAAWRHRARHARGILPAADRLLPVATAGPQSVMPIGAAQYANATTIVKQALARTMGVRSAVIAVATAMQESGLLNLDYGTGDSLGLFQQQWDMGWGTPQQIMDPAYAAGKFLAALRSYQASDPSWASQPLYQAAQGVQRSAFPYAYAQWERQAAQLTASVARALH